MVRAAAHHTPIVFRRAKVTISAFGTRLAALVGIDDLGQAELVESLFQRLYADTKRQAIDPLDQS